MFSDGKQPILSIAKTMHLVNSKLTVVIQVQILIRILIFTRNYLQDAKKSADDSKTDLDTQMKHDISRSCSEPDKNVDVHEVHFVSSNESGAIQIHI